MTPDTLKHYFTIAVIVGVLMACRTAWLRRGPAFTNIFIAIGFLAVGWACLLQGHWDNWVFGPLIVGTMMLSYSMRDCGKDSMMQEAIRVAYNYWHSQPYPKYETVNEETTIPNAKEVIEAQRDTIQAFSRALHRLADMTGYESGRN